MSSGNSNGFAGISTGNPNEKIFKYRDENMCGKWNTAEKNLGNLNVIEKCMERPAIMMHVEIHL